MYVHILFIEIIQEKAVAKFCFKSLEKRVTNTASSESV